MPGKILCVAEKPSIAKAVAGHLSGGQFTTVRTHPPLHQREIEGERERGADSLEAHPKQVCQELRVRISVPRAVGPV